MSTTTANMNLVLPTVGSELSPTWANDINADMQTIDGHNHSSGAGVQIQPNGMNINADLPFNANNAISIRAARFTPQVAPITNSGSDVGEMYVSGNELYYNDVSGGNQVQITNSGSVNAGAGSITGLPSGTASATYSAGTFVWQSATSTPANLDAGSVVLRNATASSKGLTLAPPAAMAANIAQTLPSIPAATGFMTMDSSGNMGASTAVSGGLTGTNMASNVNLPGNAVQENGRMLVVANSSNTTSLCVSMGGVTAAGTFLGGTGIGSTARITTGTYEVNWTNAFSAIPDVVVSGGNNGVAMTATVQTVSTTGCAVLTWNTAGALTNYAFSIFAMGQR